MSACACAPPQEVRTGPRRGPGGSPARALQVRVCPGPGCGGNGAALRPTALSKGSSALSFFPKGWGWTACFIQACPEHEGPPRQERPGSLGAAAGGSPPEGAPFPSSLTTPLETLPLWLSLFALESFPLGGLTQDPRGFPRACSAWGLGLLRTRGPTGRQARATRGGAGLKGSLGARGDETPGPPAPAGLGQRPAQASGPFPVAGNRLRGLGPAAPRDGPPCLAPRSCPATRPPTRPPSPRPQPGPSTACTRATALRRGSAPAGGVRAQGDPRRLGGRAAPSRALIYPKTGSLGDRVGPRPTPLPAPPLLRPEEPPPCSPHSSAARWPLGQTPRPRRSGDSASKEGGGHAKGPGAALPVPLAGGERAAQQGFPEQAPARPPVRPGGRPAVSRGQARASSADGKGRLRRAGARRGRALLLPARKALRGTPALPRLPRGSVLCTSARHS